MSWQHPIVEQLLRANKAVCQAKQTQISTCFPNLGSFQERQIHVWYDVSWVNLPDKVLCAQGHGIFLIGQQ